MHQRQIAAERFVAADAFVVSDEIAAAVKDQAIFEYFDRLHVVRGMSMHNRNALLNQAMSEHDLFTRDFVSPVAPPVD